MGSRYGELSVKERRRIERWRVAKVSPTAMARVLARYRNTIFRELQRNHFVDRCMPAVVGCFAMAAVPNVRLVKEETLPCGQNLSRIRAACGDAINGVFGGAGGRYVIDELARGALGTMPALEFADVHVRLVGAWAAGREDEARRLFAALLPALNFQAVFRMHMTKATLARRGVPVGSHVRGAGPRMDDMDRRELSALLNLLKPETDGRAATADAAE